MPKHSYDCSVEEMKREIERKGWQWLEQRFNDGNVRNTSIDLTLNKSPLALGESRHNYEDATGNHVVRIGWGRFTERRCWEEAYESIVIRGEYSNG